MRIGIIGAGNVGGALGRAWAKLGHEIVFGTSNPGSAKLDRLLAEIAGKARAATVAEAAAHGEVVVFATPWSATQDAAKNAGSLNGKIVLDCTNPLKDDLSGLTVGHTISGAEQLAQWTSSGRVVKVFNTTGSDNMHRPSYGGTAVSMFYAGDDADAKAVAADLARAIGFDPVDAGPLANARYLEPMAYLWIHMAIKQGRGPDIAYHLMQR